MICRNSKVTLGATQLRDGWAIYVPQSRHPQVRQGFEGLLAEGRLAARQMTTLEYPTNAPNPKGYEILWGAMHGQRWMDVPAQAMSRALDMHRMLTETSQHRHFRVPDLIIVATAEVRGATVLRCLGIAPDMARDC